MLDYLLSVPISHGMMSVRDESSRKTFDIHKIDSKCIIIEYLYGSLCER
jgi:hypothetical protein